MPDPRAFCGKTIWVTGAGRGIGHAIACRFVQEGGNVVGFDKAFAPEGDYPFTCITLDLAQGAAIAEACARLIAEGAMADVLVSAAGVLHMGAAEALSPDQWDEMFAVNAGALFHLLRATSAPMRERGDGRIVVIASNAAHVPRTQMAGYAASKAALVSLARSAGLQLAAFGIRCNIVSPGSTDTAMQRQLWHDAQGEATAIAGTPEEFRLGIPLGKIAQARDIAEAVLFLASDKAGHITLQDIVIDGGATLGA